MRNTKEAVRYGIETLRVTPEQLFSLIESSNGYEGNDYKRWLANEIIKIAEKDGVGFSQLLVKKFAITQSLIEDYSNEDIKEEWVSFFTKQLNSENIFSVGIDNIGSELQDVDWFSCVDIDELNNSFVKEQLPEDVSSKFFADDNVRFLLKLSSEASDKSSSLFKDAKERGIQCKNEGSVMLYRMCSLLNVYESCTNNFKFAFLCSSKFLYDTDNVDIIKHLLSYYHCGGVVVSSTELLTDSYTSGEYAFVLCRPRGLKDPIQDGLKLKVCKLEEGKPKPVAVKRYSRSIGSMLDYVKSTAPQSTDSVSLLSEDLSAILKEHVTGIKDAYGYLNIDSRSRSTLSTLPIKGIVNIPITSSNLSSVVAYYGVSRSRENFCLFGSIPEVLTGHELYSELLYNCFPLFLFDTDSKFSEYDNISNKFDISTSELVKGMLDKGEVYFSYEAKELLDVCKGFIDFLQENKESMKGKTFAQIRAEANNDDLNNAYLSALHNLKGYVSTLYKRME